jgi:hypothetical protein
MELQLSATEKKIYEGVYEYAIEQGCTEQEATRRATQRIHDLRASVEETLRLWSK